MFLEAGNEVESLSPRVYSREAREEFTRQYASQGAVENKRRLGLAQATYFEYSGAFRLVED